MSSSNAGKKPVIGFVGLGKIGAPIAERLLAAGYDLAVFDVAPAAMRPFADRAQIAFTPADTADRADAIIACLQTADQYAEAVLGDTGIVHGRRARIYLHIGTTGRQCVQTISAALDRCGVATLDAPMSGGVAGAKAGTLVSMISGPRAAFDAMEPMVSSYARRIVYLGAQPGLAQAMKLVNNMLSAANLAAAAEVMVVGAKAGLPVDVMLDVLNHGTGQNSATLTKIPNNVVPRTFDCGASLDNIFKDLTAYAAEAQAAGIDSAIFPTVIRFFREAASQGSAGDDLSTVVRPLERAAGVELKRDR